MKKILLIILLLPALAQAQDSTKIQVSIQARDIEYIASVASFDFDEPFFDAVKSKFRVQTPPTGNTTVIVDSMYIKDWLSLFVKIKNDAQALKANCVSRVETILRAVGNSFLNGKLDAIDTDDGNVFQERRGLGRKKLKRKD